MAPADRALPSYKRRCSLVKATCPAHKPMSLCANSGHRVWDELSLLNCYGRYPRCIVIVAPRTSALASRDLIETDCFYTSHQVQIGGK